MNARILLTGVLQKAPTRKISKNGNGYLVAKVREGSGEGLRWWTVFVFSDSAIEVIERLGDGEAIAATGTFEATIWTPEGREPRVSLTMTADAILSAHKPKSKEPRNKPAAGRREVPGPREAAPPLDDGLPEAWR